VRCKIDLLTNIATDCGGVLVEKALLADGKQSIFDAYAHDNEDLRVKDGDADTRQRRREENIWVASSIMNHWVPIPIWNEHVMKCFQHRVAHCCYSARLVLERPSQNKSGIFLIYNTHRD
jgi:hypothetical protein